MASNFSDVELIISGGDGQLPASVVAYMFTALGHAYPNTVIIDAERGQTVRVRIPAADWLDGTKVDVDAIEPPTRDDPQLVAFVRQFRVGNSEPGLTVSPPPWLAEALLTVTRMILEAAEPPNYYSMTLTDPQTREAFDWIICKPGGQSPHALRAQAEARTAELEVAATGPAPVVADSGWVQEFLVQGYDEITLVDAAGAAAAHADGAAVQTRWVRMQSSEWANYAATETPVPGQV